MKVVSDIYLFMTKKLNMAGKKVYRKSKISVFIHMAQYASISICGPRKENGDGTSLF